MKNKTNYLQKKLSPHLKFQSYEQTVMVVCDEEKQTTPDITEIQLTKKLIEAAKNHVYDLERERGLKDCWLFLIFGATGLFLLSFSMFGLIDIPALKLSNFPFVISRMIGCISALAGFWIMLLARKNYYLVRQYKMEILSATRNWQNLLDRYVELKIRETVKRINPF